MPWDKDIDVMVTEAGMAELGGWWNMTVHQFTASELGLAVSDSDDSTGDDREKRGIPEDEDEQRRKRILHEEVTQDGKKYLLEVNPNYINKSTRDTYNVIDARWIDTATGLYIDITTIHAAPSDPSPPISSSSEDDDIATTRIDLYTKDQHAYTSPSLFPLRASTFEDIPVRIPYAYEQILLEEYGPAALTETWFNGYGFDAERKEWVVAEPTAQQALRIWERQRERAGKGKTGWRKGAKKGGSARGRGKKGGAGGDGGDVFVQNVEEER